MWGEGNRKILESILRLLDGPFAAGAHPFRLDALSFERKPDPDYADKAIGLCGWLS